MTYGAHVYWCISACLPHCAGDIQKRECVMRSICLLGSTAQQGSADGCSGVFRNGQNFLLHFFPVLIVNDYILVVVGGVCHVLCYSVISHHALPNIQQHSRRQKWQTSNSALPTHRYMARQQSAAPRSKTTIKCFKRCRLPRPPIHLSARNMQQLFVVI